MNEMFVCFNSNSMFTRHRSCKLCKVYRKVHEKGIFFIKKQSCTYSVPMHLTCTFEMKTIVMHNVSFLKQRKICKLTKF